MTALEQIINDGISTIFFPSYGLYDRLAISSLEKVFVIMLWKQIDCGTIRVPARSICAPDERRFALSSLLGSVFTKPMYNFRHNGCHSGFYKI